LSSFGSYLILFNARGTPTPTRQAGIAGALPKKRRSRRLKIAHRFIGGDQHKQQWQSVKRTAELKSK